MQTRHPERPPSTETHACFLSNFAAVAFSGLRPPPSLFSAVSFANFVTSEGGSEDSFDWSEDEVAVEDSAPSSPFTGVKVPTQDEVNFVARSYTSCCLGICEIVALTPFIVDVLVESIFLENDHVENVKYQLCSEVVTGDEMGLPKGLDERVVEVLSMTIFFMAALRGVDYQFPILCRVSSLLTGDCGIEFLVSAWGLNPPRLGCELCVHLSGDVIVVLGGSVIRQVQVDISVLWNGIFNEDGKDNMEAILESLLAYKAAKEDGTSSAESSSSESEKDGVDEVFSDADSFLDNEEIMEPLSGKEKNLMLLVEMGFTAEDATSAMDRCGPDASLAELTDSIYAAQTAKAFDANLGKRPYFSSSDEDEEWQSCIYNNSHRDKKRQKWAEEKGWKRKPNLPTKPKPYQRNILADNTISIPNPMTGFGVPGDDQIITHRKLPEAAIGPPYFYYENVALAPKGVWETISRFLYDIQPEFVDSKFFCASARKRGYIHNLPIHDRFPIRPVPPKTIFEALPMTKKWWPAWDHRTQLNCLQTCIASSRLTERIRSALAACGDDPSPSVVKYVIEECRKWNLVWVGVHKVAPLEPDEIEMLLGFPKNHTRGGGISRTERYRSLGNSFQVDTVAYHLSVLKDLFPNGITVLSLFTGIGGGEVALHRLGIPLKTVVSVEISEINRNILRSWWDSTGQKGTLIDIPDVQQLNSDRLEQLINRYGGFDLVIGGSPCNNLTGSNRVSRDGLEGKDSALFYDYFRILDCVKCLMGN
ncbi:DNA (cytosine-5)-methyltransferase drm2 [Asimina triloba]